MRHLALAAALATLVTACASARRERATATPAPAGRAVPEEKAGAPPAPPGPTFSVVVAGSGAPGSLVKAMVENAYVLSCSAGTCTTPLPAGKVVTLTATPATGMAVQWSGACKPAGANACTVTSGGGATTVVATFAPAGTAPETTPIVSVVVKGAGTVSWLSRTCAGPATCEAPAAPGTTITLALQPAAGWSVKAVKNCILVDGRAGCRFTVPNAPLSVAVTFHQPAPLE